MPDDTGDVTVRCDGCRREERVAFAQAIATGWPTCHGQTMQLASRVSAKVVDTAVGQRFGPVEATRAALAREA